MFIKILLSIQNEVNIVLLQFGGHYSWSNDDYSLILTHLMIGRDENESVSNKLSLQGLRADLVSQH